MAHKELGEISGENREIINCLEKWAKGEKQYPYKAELRVTFKCNLCCAHCPNRIREPGKYEKELSPKSWMKIAQECVRLGVKECFIFAGGEPFTRLNTIIPMMELIKKHQIQGSTLTNGTLLDEKTMRKLIKIDWNRLEISLDGFNPDTNDYIRGKGVFNRVVNNIRMLNFLKKKLSKENPHIVLNTIVTNLIYDKLSDIITLASDLDVSAVSFHTLDSYTSVGKKLALTKTQMNELDKYVNEASRKAEKFKIDTNIEIFLDKEWSSDPRMKRDKIRNEPVDKRYPPLFSSPCFLPWYFISIKENGFVNPCHAIRDKIDNVKNKTLKQIWFGSYFQEVREKLLKGELPKWCSTECCSAQATDHLILKRKLFDRFNKCKL